MIAVDVILFIVSFHAPFFVSLRFDAVILRGPLSQQDAAKLFIILFFWKFII